jgi:uncharacterized protein YecT (DUF1311 family)
LDRTQQPRLSTAGQAVSRSTSSRTRATYGVDPAEAALLAAEYADFDAKFRAAYGKLTRTALRRHRTRQRAQKHSPNAWRAIAMIVRANPAVTRR